MPERQARFVNEREDFLLAVANYRVSRRIWARLLREQYGVSRVFVSGTHVSEIADYIGRIKNRT